jgi:hypothetical protein
MPVQNNMRMLKAATALLYFGPLLAGLGGYGWAVVPVFAAIFMLFLIIIRPQEFPRSIADWAKPEALVAFGARAAVQLLLVLVCFGIGRGIGGVLGSFPAFPYMLPIAISFLSIPSARMVWDPWKAQEMDQLLDTALSKIEGGAAASAEGDRAYAEAVTSPLNGLADDVSEAELDSHLSALRALVDEKLTFDVLLSRVTQGEASTAGKRALVVMASDGAALGRMARRDAAALAFQALGQDAGLVTLMSKRLAEALRQDPEIWASCPSISVLERIRIQLPEADNAISMLEAEIAAQAPSS